MTDDRCSSQTRSSTTSPRARPTCRTIAYERPQALAWQFFEQYEIEPNLAVARFFRIFDLEPPEDLWRQKQAGGRKGLEALERGLAGKEFLVGDRYSVADISLYAYTHVADEGELRPRALPVDPRLARRASRASPGTSGSPTEGSITAECRIAVAEDPISRRSGRREPSGENFWTA